MAVAVLQPFSPVASTSQTTLEVFQTFNAELVANQDRRERIVKISRDCTALSKRLIFHLHRIAGTNPVPAEKLFKEARAKEAEILGLFKQVSVELQGDDAWKHHRAISGGIEEYIEALAFFHYLEHRKIINLDDVRAKVGACGIHVTEEDYLCGLGDMTGELMRFGINSVGAELSHTRSSVSEAEAMIRQVKKGCEPLVPHTRMLGKKMGEMDRSLRKLEDASYTLALRGAEYAAFPEALKELVRQLQDAPVRPSTPWEERMDEQ